MPTPSNDDRPPMEVVKGMLARASVIQSACDLDLLVFLHRHPRTLLTSEQLAAFVGYNLKDIAKALDLFIEAGLLARTSQHSSHAARMFLLLLDGQQGPGLSALLEMARPREGRQAILKALNGGGTPRSVPELRVLRCA